MEQEKPLIPPPVSSDNDAVSIHLSYIRRDIFDIRQTLTDMRNAYVTRSDYEEHLKADDDHEERIRSLERSYWKYIGASGAVSAIITILGGYFINKI